MWRRHAVKVSRAEEAIFDELCRRGLGRNLHSQHPFKFEKDLLGKEGEGVKGTWVDFFWSPPGYAAMIDGPGHLKRKQEEKDKLIDEALRRRGIRVDRFGYRPPLSKRRLKEIVDSIEDRIRARTAEELKQVEEASS